MNNTNIIYLYGYSGTGKYTIAKEIAKYDYVICDNQLINNPIFELLGYDGSANFSIPTRAWETIGKMRQHLFEFIAGEFKKNYVFTNVLYEDEGDRDLFEQVKLVAEKRGSNFFPVKLLISQEENIKRISNLSRKTRFKSIDPADTDRSVPLLNVSHPNLLEIDITELSAEDVAKRIWGLLEDFNN